MLDQALLRVLIVEDDKTSRFVLRRILETMDGLEVYEAEDGLEAWEMLQGELLPQLCFLDLNMPRMNGVELLKRIRKDKRLAALKVCFCSAVCDRKLIMQAAVLQPDFYILKPYDRDPIYTQVQKARGTPRREDSLEAPAVVCTRLVIDQPTCGPQIATDASIFSKDQQRVELDALLGSFTEVFRRGKLVAANKNLCSKPLNAPDKDPFLGGDSAQTVGALTHRIPFSLTILDADTTEVIENCRKIDDLVKLLSFPLDANERWMPNAAIRLLEQELTARNAQGIRLLRQVIGPDFEAFLRQQEVIVRKHLTQLYQQAEISDQASEKQVREIFIDLREDEKQVQAILQDVRERLQPVLDGKLTVSPVFSAPDLGKLAECADDVRWSPPFALLHNAALLMRTAATDPTFNDTFKFNTFDRQIFLEAMNVFEDPLGHHPDPERAAQEIQKLEAVIAGPVSLLEKCHLIWGIIKGEAESGAPPPEVREKTSSSIPDLNQTGCHP